VIKDEIEQKNYLLWLVSALLVLVLYMAVGFGLVFFYVPSTAAVGAPEMIMIDFAPEPQAPEVEEISETIQEETIAQEDEAPAVEEPEPEPPVIEEDPLPPPPPPVEESPPLLEEPASEPEVETPPSEMVEEKPVEKQEEKIEEPKKIEPVKPPLPEKKKIKAVPERKAKQEPEKNVKKAKKTQKARGPQIVAPKGQRFAAPATNRQYGDMGKAIAGWRTKVQRRVAYAATRVRAKSGRGRVAMVKFTYNAKGVITAATITKSAGDPAVDAIALQAVNKASPIPPPPNEKAGSLTVPVKVN